MALQPPDRLTGLLAAISQYNEVFTETRGGQTYYYRQRMKLNRDDDMPEFITIETAQLREIQRLAAEHGLKVSFTRNGRYLLKAPDYEPPVPDARPDVAQILGEPRVGDEIKDKYINHVHEMFAQGYLSEEAHDARVEAMMAGSTKSLLDRMVADLPPLSTPKAVAEKPSSRLTHLNIRSALPAPMYLLLSGASFYSAAGMNPSHNPVMFPLTVAFALFCFIYFILRVVSKK